MITTLSREQAARMNQFRDQWLFHGLSTETMDKEKAKDAVRLAYRCAGKAEPKIFVFLDSPMSGAIGAAFWAQVGAQVRDQVGAQVGAQVGDQLYKCGYGLHDSSWIAFFNFFQEVCSLTCVEKLNGLIEVSKECGWWWPFENAVLITPRPSEVHRDDLRRLHNPSGMAMKYEDGWGIYAWHGIRLNDKSHIITNPEKITVAEIEAEQNAEIRRVMIERYDQARYLVDSGAKEIHADDFGILYRKEIPGDEPLVMVKVVNSTPEPDGSFKDYFIRVPPTIQRARQAVAWTFGKSEHEYEPCFES